MNWTKNKELTQRAVKVIPGGIYGHQSPVFTVPGRFPSFAVRAEGPYYWDADGHRFIDFMCGYGPLVLGARHPEVEEAVRRQMEEGDCFNHPTEHLVALAERLVEIVDMADWALFGKNGADMTRWAVRVAREATGRKGILRVRGGYHGTDAWSSDVLAGVTEGDRAGIQLFSWNDAESLRQAAEMAKGDLAAVIITPYHHPTYGDSAFAQPEFQTAVKEVCRETGALLIIDDVRAGFRLHLGGSHQVTGWEPDLVCFSKAIANGYPLAACVGKKEWQAVASRVFVTGSFWTSAVPLVAALKTLEILERENGPEKMKESGTLLVEGLVKLGEKHGLPLIASGPPAIPYVRVADDPSFERQQDWCARAVEEGVFLHPHHNWFVGLSHTPSVIEESLKALDRAMGKREPR